MVFCYQNYSDLLWEKNVLVIKKNFWNSRLQAENLQNFWDHKNNLFKQWKVRSIFGSRMVFLTCSWKFLISNKLEQLESKLEKNIEFRNMQEKLENFLSSWILRGYFHLPYNDARRYHLWQLHDWKAIPIT